MNGQEKKRRMRRTSETITRGKRGAMRKERAHTRITLSKRKHPNTLNEREFRNTLRRITSSKS